MKRDSRVRLLTLASLVSVVLLGTGCRQDMYDQPRVKPLGENDFFADKQGARPIPAHTVARGFLRENRALYAGTNADGKFVSELPVPLTKALLQRGHERFDIFCSPCHGKQGNGQGMIVQRGFKRPETYHQDRLRNQPIGYFYDVMTNGFNQMSSYASQVPVEDRWAIAAYIRALQYSQSVPAADLAAVDRDLLEKTEKATVPAAKSGAAHEGVHP